ncbi:hypothetical protein HGG78_17785 [Vibrio aestuarianus]|uniref:hypothetical protein n=1 Tax=Vibrio aestuarianus TaxID=28171 RepID=UPI00155870C0|nr:hypothetical protein [Vibrio aestuarianus]NGZ15568.1 hypothetical protein [Vibrio aestuarianus]NKZ51716.1 hypothetical protein [Vibrio aestuarianus]
MKVKVTTIVLISALVGTVQAQDIDFSLYTEQCVNDYKANLALTGSSDINGKYLKQVNSETLKYKSIYFKPDLNFGVYFNEGFGKPMLVSTYDLENDDSVYRFYSEKDNSSGRSGKMYQLKDLGNDEFSFSIFKRSGGTKIDGKRVSIFEKPVKLNKSKKEPIFEAVFKIDEDKSEDLYQVHTQFPKTCLK